MIYIYIYIIFHYTPTTIFYSIYSHYNAHGSHSVLMSSMVEVVVVP